MDTIVSIRPDQESRYLGLHIVPAHFRGVHTAWLNGDFRTTTIDQAGGLVARTESLSGHPPKQQPRSTLLDPIILR
ncbi:hypothetical protein J6590_005423 [Homalodisca vitripennis]|nr:hypothetical protein J6590_005423 [Homalodisca vitripennis]